MHTCGSLPIVIGLHLAGGPWGRWSSANNSRKQTALLTDAFSSSRGYRLTRELTVYELFHYIILFILYLV